MEEVRVTLYLHISTGILLSIDGAHYLDDVRCTSDIAPKSNSQKAFILAGSSAIYSYAVCIYIYIHICV